MATALHETDEQAPTYHAGGLGCQSGITLQSSTELWLVVMVGMQAAKSASPMSCTHQCPIDPETFSVQCRHCLI